MQSYIESILIAFQCSVENSSPCSQSSPKPKEVGCCSKCFSVRRKNTQKRNCSHSSFLIRAEMIKFTSLKKHVDLPCSQSCSFSSVALLVELIHKYFLLGFFITLPLCTTVNYTQSFNSFTMETQFDSTLVPVRESSLMTCSARLTRCSFQNRLNLTLMSFSHDGQSFSGENVAQQSFN